MDFLQLEKCQTGREAPSLPSPHGEGALGQAAQGNCGVFFSGATFGTPCRPCALRRRLWGGGREGASPPHRDRRGRDSNPRPQRLPAHVTCLSPFYPLPPRRRARARQRACAVLRLGPPASPPLPLPRAEAAAGAGRP